MDLTAILAVVTKYIPIVTAIIAACAAIAAVTPTKVDDDLINLILNIINKLGLNVGKAENKDA